MNPITSLFIHEFLTQNLITKHFKHLFDGNDIWSSSEAGNPCIADPGHSIVNFAFRHDIKVIPMVGPSSILLHLISSGFNGQNFTFHGYLSAKKPELKNQLKALETQGAKVFTNPNFHGDTLPCFIQWRPYYKLSKTGKFALCLLLNFRRK